jgi:Polysaccharide biosynthesis/export protein
MGRSQFSPVSADSRIRLLTLATAGVMPLLATAAIRATDAEPLLGQATYRFARGDRITISVFGQSDFSDESLLDGTGEISLPAVDPIPVGGMTESEITKGCPAAISATGQWGYASANCRKSITEWTGIEIEREQACNQCDVQKFTADLAELNLQLRETDVKI